jgi:hypothetical protein
MVQCISNKAVLPRLEVIANYYIVKRRLILQSPDGKQSIYGVIPNCLIQSTRARDAVSYHVRVSRWTSRRERRKHVECGTRLYGVC